MSKLNRLRIARARPQSSGGGTPTPPSSGAKLLYKAPGVTQTPGNVRTVPPVDAGGPEHYIGFTYAGDADWALGIGADATGSGQIFRRAGNDSRWTLYNGVMSADPGTWAIVAFGQYKTYPSSLIAGQTRIEARRNLNGTTGLYIDGVVALIIPATGTGANYKGTYVSFRQPDGAIPIGVTYGAPAIPILVNSSTLTAQLNAEVTIAYTNAAGQSDLPNIQLCLTDGVTPVGPKQQATLVSNPSAGIATIRSATAYGADQYGTKPKVKVLEVVNGVETGSFGLTEVTMPSNPATFGTNLMDVGSGIDFRRYANAYLNSSGGISLNNVQLNDTQMDASGYPTISGAKKYIGMGDVSGATRVMTWDGDGVVAEMGGGDVAFSAKTVVNANTYSWVENFNRTVTGNSADVQHIPRGYVVLNPTSANYPKNIRIYTQGEDRTAIWPASYLAMHAKPNGFNGARRFMDARNINGTADIELTWAMRSVQGSPRGGPDGIPIEDAIVLCNTLGVDMWLPYAPVATDDYLTQLAIAIDTGANLSQGKPWSNGLAPGLKWYVERSNEVWNPQFPIWRLNGDRYSARTGEPRLGASEGGNDQGLKEHAYQYDRQMAIIMAAIPNWQNRIVRVFAGQLGDTPLGYNYAMRPEYGGGRYIDAYALAPYIQVKAPDISALPDRSPASLEALYVPQATAVIEGMSVARNKVKANGHRFICYEGALDMAAAGNALSTFEIMAFRQSPSYYRMLYAHYNYWKANFGDLYMQFGDTGGNPYYPYQWGLQSYQGETPLYGWQALQDVQAGLPSRY